MINDMMKKSAIGGYNRGPDLNERIKGVLKTTI
jgi:hypothetical protein